MPTEPNQTVLQKILEEIADLSKVWKSRQHPACVNRAKQFVQEHQDTIRRAANEFNPSGLLIRCIEGLVECQHRLQWVDEEMRCSDEDLLLDVIDRFRPTDPAIVKYNSFEKHNWKSKIYSRRAFREASLGELDSAAALMDEALRSINQAVNMSPRKARCSISNRLEMFKFFNSTFKMQAFEAKREPDLAKVCWEEAQYIAERRGTSSGLFAKYFWDIEDLRAYRHLLDAQCAWFREDFDTAVFEYDCWMACASKYQRLWRYRNVRVRRHLAAVLACLLRQCPGCEGCQNASEQLMQLSQDWFLGAAGRYLASTGQSLRQLKLFATGELKKRINELKLYVPLGTYYRDFSERIPEGHFWSTLPDYFRSLPSEIKKLELNQSDPGRIRELVRHRLRQFLEINCEYEEGRVANRGGPVHSTTLNDELDGKLSSTCQRIVKARSLRKGAADKGVRDWVAVSRLVAEAEKSDDYKTGVDSYESVVTKIAGLFPAVVRVTSRQEAGNVYLTFAETLSGDQLRFESDRSLQGTFAFLPPRYHHNPSDLKLTGQRVTWWVPSSRYDGIYALQTMDLWNGSWSEIGQEHPESFNLDYKERIPEKRSKVARHLAAFANLNGGWLVIGVFDPKLAASQDTCTRNLSLDEAAQAYDLIGTACFREIAPPIAPPKIFRAYPNGHLVLLCKVQPSELCPHLVDNKIYIRMGAKSEPVSKEQWYKIAQTKQRHL